MIPDPVFVARKNHERAVLAAEAALSAVVDAERALMAAMREQLEQERRRPCECREDCDCHQKEY